MSDERLILDESYQTLLAQLKERIRTAQVQAALSVNRELVLLYWQIGRDILTRQRAYGWGAKVIDRLAADLRIAFPEMKGFSPRNLKYMRAFADAWPQEPIVQEALAQITWYHNLALLEKLATSEERLWYARMTVQYGWSRNVLVHQIESGLYHRQGKALTNFDRLLPAPQSELARQLLKDPYHLDFLTLSQEAQERELQTGLLLHLRQFLLELGAGFSFVGSPYRLEVGGDEFEIDMLFYHLRLRCFVVIDLKIGKFTPQDAGQMSFYLAVIDDYLRHPRDAPSIGMILCKTKNRVVVEYALKATDQPIGVAEYRLTHLLPEHLKGRLPTIEEMETELQDRDPKTP